MQNKKKDFKIVLSLLINKIKRKLHYITMISLLSMIASTVHPLFAIENQYQAETLSSVKLPTFPVSLLLFNHLIIAAILGILLGFVFIILSYSFDTRIHKKEQLESLLGIPVLDFIPIFENKR